MNAREQGKNVSSERPVGQRRIPYKGCHPEPGDEPGEGPNDSREQRCSRESPLRRKQQVLFHCIDAIGSRTVPRAGFAAAQDDIVDFWRESSQALAYFQET